MVAQFIHRFGLILGLVVGLIVGVLLPPRHQTISTTTTVDTVVFYRPIPITTTTAEVRIISIPRLLFAPADTVHTTIVLQGDSVQMSVPIERREYRDRTYYAIVSGAAVGDIHPTLEHIETYAKNTTQTIYTQPPKVRPYVSAMLGKESIGAGAGILLANKHAFGVEYIYNGDKGSLMAKYAIVFR